MKLATISSQRQITLPKALLKALDLEVKDRLFLMVENKQLIAKPITKSIVNELAGSWADQVAAGKKGQSFKEIMQSTKKNTARKLAHE